MECSPASYNRICSSQCPARRINYTTRGRDANTGGDFGVWSDCIPVGEEWEFLGIASQSGRSGDFGVLSDWIPVVAWGIRLQAIREGIDPDDPDLFVEQFRQLAVSVPSTGGLFG